MMAKRPDQRILIISGISATFLVPLASKANALILISEEQQKRDRAFFVIAYFLTFTAAALLLSVVSLIILRLLNKTSINKQLLHQMIVNLIVTIVTFLSITLIEPIATLFEESGSGYVDITIFSTYASILFQIFTGISFILLGKFIHKLNPHLKKYLTLWGVVIIVVFTITLISIILWSPKNGIVSCYGPTCL